jgi:hypothetical protein
MSRYFLGSLLIGLLLVSSDASFAAGDSCISSEYAVNYSQRQVQLTQNSLIRQQNALLSLQSRIDARTLSYQLQVDQALAWKQAAAGMTLGNTVGCALRTVRWGGSGRCFANSVSFIVRTQSRANAAYNLAVNRLNTYQNSASLQVSRMQQRVAQAQMSYDSALNSYKSTEDTYLKCRSAQSAT